MRAILVAGGPSLLLTLLITPQFIKFLTRRQYGQFIHDDGPKEHLAKRGTPAMGGVAVIASVVLSCFLARLILWELVTASGVLLVGVMTALGFLGFLGDWAKISKEHSLGLTPRGKLIGQFTIGGVFAVLALNLLDERDLHPASELVSFLRDPPWLHLPFFLVVVWIVFLLMAWPNVTNLTNGLDGLLAGSTTLVLVAFSLVNIWQFNQWCDRVSNVDPFCYEVRDPCDLAVVSMVLAGSRFGFLWWGAKPARIFVGDTGSMAIGAALAGLSIMTRTELLLVIMEFLFVMEAGSMAFQVGYFKATKGRRIFRISPIHRHFGPLGRQEVTMVIRFWVICGLCVAIGVGIFYAEWVVDQ